MTQAAMKIEALYPLFLQRAGLEVLTATNSEKRSRITCRLQPNRFQFWVLVLETLNKASDDVGVPWTCDISKLYMNKDGGVRFCWRLIFETKVGVLADHVPHIMGVIQSAPRPKQIELTEVTLPGYKEGQSRGGVNSSGKGAAEFGHNPVGAQRRT